MVGGESATAPLQWRRATFFVARRSRVLAVRAREATKNVARRHFQRSGLAGPLSSDDGYRTHVNWASVLSINQFPCILKTAPFGEMRGRAGRPADPSDFKRDGTCLKPS